MTTRFLIPIISVITCGTVWAQTPHTKSTVKNSIHIRQMGVALNHVSANKSNLRSSSEREKYARDILRYNARSKSELDHLGAYNFSVVFPKKNTDMRQRKTLYRH